MMCCSSTSDKRPRALRVVSHIACGLVLGVALAAVLSLVVMVLWNHLMPQLFHLPVISYCQGLGLFILGRLLFGGLCHGSRRFHGHRRCGCHSKEEESVQTEAKEA